MGRLNSRSIVARSDVEQQTTTVKMGNRDSDKDAKAQWSLVDFKALEPMVRVLMANCPRYGIDNWKNGLGYRSLCESLMRHVIEFLDGEDNDKRDNLHHVGYILCNAMFLSYMIQHRPDLDDRKTERISPKPKSNAEQNTGNSTT
jgi:hypothetical protein